MTDNDKTPETKTEQPFDAPQAENVTVSGEGSVEEIEIEPTLSGYFKEKRASPSAFFKVLRKHEVKRFQQSDRAAAEKIMAYKDPEGERLWALMAYSSLPESVDVWIWSAALARLKEHFGDAFNPGENNTRRILKTVLTELGAALGSEKKEERKHAETWLRITVCWLMEKRNLSAWQVAEDLQTAFIVNSSKAQEVIQKGKSRELQIAVAMAGLGDELVKSANEDRDKERNTSTDLRHSLHIARTKIEGLRTELVIARQTIAEHEKRVSELEKTLSNERQHWGHDLTETKAGQKVLLGEKLGPLLNDAIDALEIDPPEPGIALRRMKAAASVIEGAKE
jgi:hypothetical protein